MSTSVVIRLTGDKDAIASLQKLGKSLVLFQSALGKAGTELKDFYSNTVFASQGGILGERWPALSAKYKLYKATGHTTLNRKTMRKNVKNETYPGAGMLVRTGKMKRSFKSVATQTSLTISNTSPHFGYHQSDAPRSKMPRRVMLKVTPEVKSLIANIIHDDVTDKIRKAGL